MGGTKVMWKFPINAMIDITTRCNAGCPQCHRTDPMGLNKASWLPDIVWNLEQFKQAFPKEIAKLIYIFDFCGTWGDCITNKDILPIVKYIREVAPDSIINIATNGSLRNDEFWWELGVAGDKNLSVVFDVEGTTQEMHQHYRQFTFLNKVLRNMDMLSQTRAKIKSQTLVWKHNEKHLQDIENLCMKHGSQRHHFVATDRFRARGTDKTIYYIKDKKYVLEKTSDNWQNVFRQTHQEFKEDENRPDYKRIENIADSNSDYTRIDRRRFTTQQVSEEEKLENEKLKETSSKCSIACEWGLKNKVVVNPDGQVLPCCYFCNPHFLNKNSPDAKSKFVNNPVMIEYEKHKKELNVFTASLVDIIKHKWFQATLIDSWEGDNMVPQCKTYCSKYKL